MKRLVFILVCVFTSQLFNSCTKDENQVGIASLLVGEWQPRQFVYNCEGTGEHTVETGTFCDLDRLIFTANGIFSAITYDAENECATSEIITGTWNVLDNDLYLVVNDDASVAQIFLANSEALRLGDLLTDNPCNTDIDNREPSFYFYEYDRLN